MVVPMALGLLAKGAMGLAKKGGAKLLGGLFGRGSRKQRYQEEEPMYQPEPFQFQAAQIQPMNGGYGGYDDPGYEMEEVMNYRPRRRRGFY
jgi:hypothetical protein